MARPSLAESLKTTMDPHKLRCYRENRYVKSLCGLFCSKWGGVMSEKVTISNQYMFPSIYSCSLDFFFVQQLNKQAKHQLS